MNALAPAPAPADQGPDLALGLHDTCDRCGYQAYVAVLLRGGGELRFCGHHYGVYEAALLAHVTAVSDHRKDLEP